MDLRILDLDGSLTAQRGLRAYQPVIHAAGDWGPRIRLACSFSRFRHFERDLAERLGTPNDEMPWLTMYGSGDFHHVSLAFVRRVTRPFNLLVVDNHPDWMTRLPFLHCGTWLYHAARLPLVRNVYHLGGDVDFDNSFRWLAPWRLLRSGRISVFPAVRRYRGGAWDQVPHEPLRPAPDERLTHDRLEMLLQPHRDELEQWPLYVSLDKDVMQSREAVVNWDSGHLELEEVQTILDVFRDWSQDQLAGMDIVGDWSPVRLHGLFRRMFHLTEHPALSVTPGDARRCNERTNQMLLTASGAELQPTATAVADFDNWLRPAQSVRIR
jgi:hypothetical protein